MNRAVARVLALVAVSTITVGGIATSATAEQTTIADQVGDVWSPEGGRDFTAEGSVVNTDLERTRVRHHASAVVIRSMYVNLKKMVSDEITFHAYLRTDAQRLYEVLIQIDSRGRTTTYRLSRQQTGRSIECDGLEGATRFVPNTVRVLVPRVCLGNPQWVRFQGKAESYQEEAGLFIDDAAVAGPRSQYPTKTPWTGRLARG